MGILGRFRFAALGVFFFLSASSAALALESYVFASAGLESNDNADFYWSPTSFLEEKTDFSANPGMAVTAAYGVKADILPLMLQIEGNASAFTGAADFDGVEADIDVQLYSLAAGAYYNIPLNDTTNVNFGGSVGRGWIDYTSNDIAMNTEDGGRMAWHLRTGFSRPIAQGDLYFGLRYSRMMDAEVMVDNDTEYTISHSSISMELGLRHFLARD